MDRLVISIVAVLVAADVARAQTLAATSDARALELMAQCRAASGGAALDRHDAFHETGTIIRDGIAGTYEMYADLHALRTVGVHTLNGKFGAGGYDGKTAWRLVDGKLSATDDPKAVSDARSGAYFTIGGYQWPDRFPATFKSVGAQTYNGEVYDVVEVTPDGATAADLWLDQRTHRLKRGTVPHDGASDYADIWDDRLVDGTWIGFRNHQVEGEHQMDQTLASFDYVPLDPSRFSQPEGNR